LSAAKTLNYGDSPRVDSKGQENDSDQLLRESEREIVISPLDHTEEKKVEDWTR
jgi:hypothetical protein